MEACCEDAILSGTSEARENSYSDIAASLPRGMSDSEVGAGEDARTSWLVSNILLTKQQRVLMTRESVKISCGTHVRRTASGGLATLRLVGGGAYFPNKRRSARRCEIRREPVSGIVRK